MTFHDFSLFTKSFAVASESLKFSKITSRDSGSRKNSHPAATSGLNGQCAANKALRFYNFKHGSKIMDPGKLFDPIHYPKMGTQFGNPLLSKGNPSGFAEWLLPPTQPLGLIFDSNRKRLTNNFDKFKFIISKN